jgi:hypothetical protein
MHFETTLMARNGNDIWVDNVAESAIKCLQLNDIPVSGVDCDNCRYYFDRQKIYVS